jgi:hypothetical protein
MKVGNALDARYALPEQVNVYTFHARSALDDFGETVPGFEGMHACEKIIAQVLSCPGMSFRRLSYLACPSASAYRVQTVY